MGLSITDMALLDVGTITDMMIESGNDNETYDYIATQEDFDKF